MKGKIFWRLVFLVSFFESLWFAYLYIKGFPGWSFRDFLNLIILIPATYGIYIYVFRKIEKRKFWKTFFIFYILDGVLAFLFFIPKISQIKLMQFLYSANVPIEAPTTPLGCLCLLSLLVLIPQLYILFRLGFPKKNN